MWRPCILVIYIEHTCTQTVEASAFTNRQPSYTNRPRTAVLSIDYGPSKNDVSKVWLWLIAHLEGTNAYHALCSLLMSLVNSEWPRQTIHCRQLVPFYLGIGHQGSLGRPILHAELQRTEVYSRLRSGGQWAIRPVLEICNQGNEGAEAALRAALTSRS
ncbi:hypothetical protein DEU56DRAFT_794952 [Suillus clintonianus]|uniref:uncharacterized protein n=1 Tax=Suillus clintonianus TaxID=1904413 RepID=UPI001B87324F|nr:uncharacterized protein DEU56DRAFT_794952 [Suillus clintonianus]KAG2141829.1 hypothetical protein DEU56DRAFT_794952 [Suillus clintonianus]